MASNITADNIDANFPVAGQDNNSQGFRDNFNLVKNSLTAAKAEIENLQTDTAKVDEDNDFGGNKLVNFQAERFTESVYSYGAVATDIDVDWEFAPYQLLQASGDITLTLIDWPNSPKHGKLKLQITGDGTERTISWVAGNGGTIKKDSSWPASFTVTSINDPVFVELWTTNGGVTVFARYLGQYTS